MAGLVGEVGEVRSKLSPVGKIFVHGEYWNARADGEIDVGEKVKVLGYDGMCLKVSRLSQSQSGS
jgi:membrane-bound serine protease (ClpP class)